MKHMMLCSALLAALAVPSAPDRVNAQAAIGTGAFSICVVSHDAGKMFYTSKLSTGGDAAKGEDQYARFLASLVKDGKAAPEDKGNCYFGDDGERITKYVQHLDDGCDNCAKWTLVETDWTPATAD